MTIEATLERIAEALETLAAGKPVTPVPTAAEVMMHRAATGKGLTECLNELKAGVEPKAPPAPPVSEEPEAPEVPAAPPVPEVPAAPVVSADELNKFLVAECGRLGGREKIDTVLREQFSVQGIKDLPEAKYQELMDAVKELA